MNIGRTSAQSGTFPGESLQISANHGRISRAVAQASACPMKSRVSGGEHRIGSGRNPMTGRSLRVYRPRQRNDGHGRFPRRRGQGAPHVVTLLQATRQGHRPQYAPFPLPPRRSVIRTPAEKSPGRNTFLPVQAKMTSSGARKACKPDSVQGHIPHGWPFIWARGCPRALATYPDLPGAAHPRVMSPMRSLFGLAPGGACRAASVASRAVSSYPTVSPLPRRRGGLFSVALSLKAQVRPGRALPAAVTLWSPDFPHPKVRPPGLPRPGRFRRRPGSRQLPRRGSGLPDFR